MPSQPEPFAFNSNCLPKVYQRGQLSPSSACSTRPLSNPVRLSKDDKTLPGCILLLSLFCLHSLHTDDSTLIKNESADTSHLLTCICNTASSMRPCNYIKNY